MGKCNSGCSAKLCELEQSFRYDEQRKNAEERAKTQLKYLNPLRVAAMDFRDRLSSVNRRVERTDTFLADTVSEISAQAEGDTERFAKWANGIGQYALSTMHIIFLTQQPVRTTREGLSRDGRARFAWRGDRSRN